MISSDDCNRVADGTYFLLKIVNPEIGIISKADPAVEKSKFFIRPRPVILMYCTTFPSTLCKIVTLHDKSLFFPTYPC